MSDIAFNVPDKIKTVSPYWLFRHSMKDNFNRADVLVRMLTIDNFFQKKDAGFYLYNQMQQVRCAQNIKIPQYQASHQQAFINLIQSFEKGYDFNFPIIVNKRQELLDGAHRLALSLYHHIDIIPIQIMKTDFCVDYSLLWFQNNGFKDYEQVILQKYYNILREYEK